MLRIPNLIFLPAFYERLLLRGYRLIVPLIMICLSFILAYMPWGDYIEWHIMFDVPAILLFCLFFVRRKYINISLFFVVTCFFEAEYRIPFMESLFFYGLFAALLYGFLKFRDYHFTHYSTLMFVFMGFYLLNMAIYGLFVLEEFDYKYILEQWIGVVAIYPIFFHIFYKTIIQNSKNMLLYEI